MSKTAVSEYPFTNLNITRGSAHLDVRKIEANQYGKTSIYKTAISIPYIIIG